MKLIVNVFKSLAILYWVLAAGLFTSMLFFPSAIDTLYNGYTQFAEVIEVEEEPTCLALIPECGYYGEVETEEPVVEEESSEPVTEESEEPVVKEESEEPVVEEESSEPVTEESEEPVVEEESEEPVVEEESEEATTESEEPSEPVTTEEETTEPSETEEESSEESSEPETTSEGETTEVDPSSEEPTTSEEETTEPTEEEEEVVIDEETLVDPIPEEETVIDEEEYVFLPSITSREEFVTALESLLVYSAIIMLPFTILAFSIGKRLGSYSEEVSVSQTSEEKAKAKLLGKKAKVDKKLESIKSIGITGIKIKK
jgi:hypothetical protein